MLDIGMLLMMATCSTIFSMRAFDWIFLSRTVCQIVSTSLYLVSPCLACMDHNKAQGNRHVLNIAAFNDHLLASFPEIVSFDAVPCKLGPAPFAPA